MRLIGKDYGGAAGGTEYRLLIRCAEGGLRGRSEERRKVYESEASAGATGRSTKKVLPQPTTLR